MRNIMSKTWTKASMEVIIGRTICENNTHQESCKVRIKEPLSFLVSAMGPGRAKQIRGPSSRASPKENPKISSVGKIYLIATPFLLARSWFQSESIPSPAPFDFPPSQTPHPHPPETKFNFNLFLFVFAHLFLLHLVVRG